MYYYITNHIHPSFLPVSMHSHKCDIATISENKMVLGD